MNALVLSEHFRAAFAADPAITGTPAVRSCVNDQSPGELTRPCLIFMADTTPISAKGTAFNYKLTVWVETSGECPEGAPDPAEEHAAAVQAVEQKLFGILGHADSEEIEGAPSPRGEALMVTLSDEDIFDFRGWNRADGTPGFETHHFRTPVAITGTALVIGPEV